MVYVMDNPSARGKSNRQRRFSRFQFEVATFFNPLITKFVKRVRRKSQRRKSAKPGLKPNGRGSRLRTNPSPKLPRISLTKTRFSEQKRVSIQSVGRSSRGKSKPRHAKKPGFGKLLSVSMFDKNKKPKGFFQKLGKAGSGNKKLTSANQRTKQRTSSKHPATNCSIAHLKSPLRKPRSGKAAQSKNALKSLNRQLATGQAKPARLIAQSLRGLPVRHAILFQSDLSFHVEQDYIGIRINKFFRLFDEKHDLRAAPNAGTRFDKQARFGLALSIYRNLFSASGVRDYRMNYFLFKTLHSNWYSMLYILFDSFANGHRASQLQAKAQVHAMSQILGGFKLSFGKFLSEAHSRKCFLLSLHIIKDLCCHHFDRELRAVSQGTHAKQFGSRVVLTGKCLVWVVSP